MKKKHSDELRTCVCTCRTFIQIEHQFNPNQIDWSGNEKYGFSLFCARTSRLYMIFLFTPFANTNIWTFIYNNLFCIFRFYFYFFFFLVLNAMSNCSLYRNKTNTIFECPRLFSVIIVYWLIKKTTSVWCLSKKTHLIFFRLSRFRFWVAVVFH